MLSVIAVSSVTSGSITMLAVLSEFKKEHPAIVVAGLGIGLLAGGVGGVVIGAPGALAFQAINTYYGAAICSSELFGIGCGLMGAVGTKYAQQRQ